jgi:hypothetical protein
LVGVLTYRNGNSPLPEVSVKSVKIEVCIYIHTPQGRAPWIDHFSYTTFSSSINIKRRTPDTTLNIDDIRESCI